MLEKIKEVMGNEYKYKSYIKETFYINRQEQNIEVSFKKNKGIHIIYMQHTENYKVNLIGKCYYHNLYSRRFDTFEDVLLNANNLINKVIKDEKKRKITFG